MDVEPPGPAPAGEGATSAVAFEPFLDLFHFLLVFGRGSDSRLASYPWRMASHSPPNRPLPKGAFLSGTLSGRARACAMQAWRVTTDWAKMAANWRTTNSCSLLAVSTVSGLSSSGRG